MTGLRGTNLRVCLTLLALLAGALAAAQVPGPDQPETDATEKSEILAKFKLADLIRPPPTTASPEQRDSYTAFAEALATESFTEAEMAAKRSVELVDDAAAGAATERARTLHNLAIVQQFLGENESAKQNYSAVLNMYASAHDNLSTDLILPLRGLAIAHLDTGDSLAALQAMDRAQHVSNVNFGPHSLRQLPILDAKMQLHLDNDDVKSGLKVLDRIFQLYTRKYPRNSEELLPGLYQKAEIYGGLKMYGEEYRAWRSILEIKENHLPENDLALVEPHVRIAEVHVRDLRKTGYRHVTTSPAERHLKEALRIAENNPEGDWEMRKDCLLSLADFYTLFDMKGRARRYYAQAWDLLSSDESYIAARHKEFSSPVPLARPSVERYAKFEYHADRHDIGEDDFVDGEMTLAFTVDERGRTKDFRIVQANPEDFTQMEIRARNLVDDFVYRPRYVAGEPVVTGELQHKIEFFYLPSEYQTALNEAAKPRSPWQSK